MIDIHQIQQPGTKVERYASPGTLHEALLILAASGAAARVVAGGTDLMVALDRGAYPDVEVLVDISRIVSLAKISSSDTELRIGAMVTHNQIVASNECQGLALALTQASLEVGSPPLRNRATVVGNVVTASPANDTISALLVLGASVEIASLSGSRTCDLADFITGFRSVALQPEELVTAIVIPLPEQQRRSIFVKAGLRRAQAISVVHLAVAVTFEGGRVTGAKLAIGSVGSTVLLVPELEALLTGKLLGSDEITAAAEAAAAAATPIDDLRSTAQYRRDLVQTMTARALKAISNDTQAVMWPSNPPLLSGAQRTGRAAGEVLGQTGVSTDITFGDVIDSTIDGHQVTLPGAAGVSMLDWLRDSGFHGVKEGCAEGECGACVVHLDGAAVISCLIPAGRASGASITTVHGISSDEKLHPIQSAFLDAGAVQCGFCTPGFLMSCSKLLEEIDQPTREQVERSLSGNICRCTGYRAIETAVEIASREGAVQ